MKGKYYVIWCKIRAFLPIRRWCGLICICGLIAACDNSGDGDGVSGTFNLEGEEIAVTTVVHETQSELRNAYQTKVGGDLVEQGFAIATYDPFNGHKCEVHVTKVRSVTDNTRINTWGHEYMHCVYGLWHK